MTAGISHAQVTFNGALAAGTTTGDPLGAAADMATTFVTSSHAPLAAKSDPACVETKVVGGVTTTINHFTPDGLDCAAYRATIATTGSVSTLLHITTGKHYLNQQILVPGFLYSGMKIVCDAGAEIIANVDMGPMVYHPATAPAGSLEIDGRCTWNLNHHATGALWLENLGGVHINGQQFAKYIKQGDTRYTFYTFGTPAGSLGDARIYHIAYGAGGGAKSGTATDIRATLSGGHTGYITGWTVGLQAASCTVTNRGTAPNATITTGTFQAAVTGGGFTDEPTIYYTVGSDGYVSSCAVDGAAYGFMGSSAPTATVLASGPAGAVLTVAVNSGGYKYGQNIDFAGGVNNGTIPLILGHGKGQYPCTTMPPKYDATSSSYGTMMTPPTWTYSADGLNYIATVSMPAGVDPTTWTSGCADQYTDPTGVVHDVPIMLHLYTGEPIANGIVTRFFDSDSTNFDGVSGFECGVTATNGGNVYQLNHFYGDVRWANCDSGGNEWNHMEHDSEWDALGLVTNATSTFTHTRQGFDAGGTHAGAAMVVWAQGSGSGQVWKDSIDQAATVYPAHFTKYICPTGPCESASVGYSSAYRIDDGNSVTEPAHEFQPLGMKAFIMNHATASASQTIFNSTGSIELSFDIKANIGCTAVATGTATLTVTYKDVSNATASIPYSVDCSVAQAKAGNTVSIRAGANSAFAAVLTDTSGVSVSGSVTLTQTTPN